MGERWTDSEERDNKCVSPEEREREADCDSLKIQRAAEWERGRQARSFNSHWNYSSRSSSSSSSSVNVKTFPVTTEDLYEAIGYHLEKGVWSDGRCSFAQRFAMVLKWGLQHSFLPLYKFCLFSIQEAKVHFRVCLQFLKMRNVISPHTAKHFNENKRIHLCEANPRKGDWTHQQIFKIDGNVFWPQ